MDPLNTFFYKYDADYGENLAEFSPCWVDDLAEQLTEDEATRLKGFIELADEARDFVEDLREKYDIGYS